VAGRSEDSHRRGASDLAAVEAIDRRLAALYGEVDWRHAQGIVHVLALGGPNRSVIAIGPRAPRSATDRFVLGAARARADAILTTGAILRAEPDLVIRAGSSIQEDRTLLEWRRVRLGRAPNPQRRIVLSGSGAFAPDHPALAGASGFVWTSARGRERLGDRVQALDVLVAEGEASGIRGALAHALSLPGVETILVEAGPTASAALYDLDSASSVKVAAGGPAKVSPQLDELLLSHSESELHPAAVGPDFVDAEGVDRVLGPAISTVRVNEPSGSWRFMRHRRQEGRAPGQGAGNRCWQGVWQTGA
jgi:riboflavin biosynthesis pyrimidine reductase